MRRKLDNNKNQQPHPVDALVIVPELIMEKIEMDKGLIKLAEKIIDQNDKIVKMNGMVLEVLSKPNFSVGCRPDFLKRFDDMDEETKRKWIDGELP